LRSAPPRPPVLSVRRLSIDFCARAQSRHKVDGITFWFRRDENTPALVEDPASDLFPFAEIRFANGKCRYIVFAKGVIMTLPWP
jgi:hypothetical protein